MPRKRHMSRNIDKKGATDSYQVYRTLEKSWYPSDNGTRS